MSETDTSIHIDAGAAVHGDVEHPGEAEYVRIAVILALITGVEVAVYDHLPAERARNLEWVAHDQHWM